MSIRGPEAYEAFLQSENLRAVFRHWNAARGDRAMPLRNDIDPTLLGRVLPLVWLYERDDDGEFFCRLSGESVNTAHDHSIMRRPAREIFGSEYDFPIRQRMDFVLDTPAVLFGSMMRPSENRSVMRISLPLGDKSARPKYTFGATEYVDPLKMREGYRPLVGQVDDIVLFSLPDFERISSEGI